MSHRKYVGLGALLVLSLLPWPALAETASINDDEPGREAYFLAIKSARFVNGADRVVVRAEHPGLELDYVDYLAFWVQTGRSKSRAKRLTYVLQWFDGHSSPRLLVLKGTANHGKYIDCPGARLRRSEKRHFIKMVVPHGCMTNDNQVRTNYVIANWGGDVKDTVPGHASTGDAPGPFTRWLRSS